MLVFLILYFSSPFIAGFFKAPQAIPVIQVIGVLPLITGFKNVGILCFQKELEFNKLFMYEFSATITNLSLAGGTLTHSGGTTVNSGDTLTAARSEARRVGTAGRSRWSP